MKKKIVILMVASLVTFNSKPMKTGVGEDVAYPTKKPMPRMTPAPVPVDMAAIPDKDYYPTVQSALLISSGAVEKLLGAKPTTTISAVLTMENQQLLNFIQKAVGQVPSLLDRFNAIKTSTEPQNLAIAATVLSLNLLNAMRDGQNETIAPFALATVRFLVEKAKEHVVNKNYEQAAALVAPLLSVSPLLTYFNLSSEVNKNVLKVIDNARTLQDSIKQFVAQSVMQNIENALQSWLSLQRTIVGLPKTTLGYPGEKPVPVVVEDYYYPNAEPLSTWQP